MSNYFLTLYKRHNAPDKDKDLDIENYIGSIKHGAYQDGVIKGRQAKQAGKMDEYKAIKNAQPCVTGSATMNNGVKTEKNIKKLNGLIVIDIDKEISDDQLRDLKDDKYTYILHDSFGGKPNVCIFVKINQKKDFRDSFQGLAQYYLDTYGVTVDIACSNPNRLRYMSYDPEIFVNEKSAVFTTKYKPEKVKPNALNFVYTKSDFDNILEQIKERGLDLCNEQYERYVKIGMALASHFGTAGEETFHFICSYGSKYKPDDAKKDYAGFCANSQGKVSIASIYYLAKEAGLSLYSERTKQIIQRVKTSKATGVPTFDSIASNMKNAHDVDLTDDDRELVDTLIKSEIDYSKECNEGVSEREQLERFIVETFEPKYDNISNTVSIMGSPKAITDRNLNDILSACQKNMDFRVTIGDVRSVLASSCTEIVDVLKNFFKENTTTQVGLIEEYARCIKPESDYNVWAFTRWICGAVHNWTTHENDYVVSPLTLVLTGTKHGTGKTSFFRNIMPDELAKYFVSQKIDVKDKDSTYRMCTSLVVFDDEFGGRSMKDIKEFKFISDVDKINQRRPFGSVDESFRRRAVLCGTSNENDILRDVTGNRRILPINVESTAYDKMIKFDVTAMLCEAYNMINGEFGKGWIIRTDEDMAYLKEHTQANEQVLPADELFKMHFALEQCDTYSIRVVMNQGELLEYFAGSSMSKMTKNDLRDVITLNALTPKSHRPVGKEKPKNGFLLYKKFNPYQDSNVVPH